MTAVGLGALVWLVGAFFVCSFFEVAGRKERMLREREDEIAELEELYQLEEREGND